MGVSAGKAASVRCRAAQAAAKAPGLFMAPAAAAAGAAVPRVCQQRGQPSGCCGPPALAGHWQSAPRLCFSLALSEKSGESLISKVSI